MNVAVVLAGGTGSRIGADIPKQFIPVLGKPVLAYTLECLQGNEQIDAIEIVYHRDWVREAERIVSDYGISKTRWMTEGGDTFQDSTINGVFNLRGEMKDDDILVLSFGVSPFTTDEIIDDSIRVCKAYGNGIASEDMVLSTCIKDDELGSTQDILRETLKGFANPWSFRYGELVAAYEEAQSRGILDTLDPHTTSVYLALGKKLYFSKTNRKNFKITTREDLDIFEGLLLLAAKREEENKG